MLDRARWTGKLEEAEVYRRWIVGKLSTPLVEAPKPSILAAVNVNADKTQASDDEDLKKAA